MEQQQLIGLQQIYNRTLMKMTMKLIDGRIIRKKAAFRMGSVFNNNSSSGSKEAANTWTRGSNRTITPLQTSATSSSQSNVNLITKTPPSKYGVISVSKGFEYTPGNMIN